MRSMYNDQMIPAKLNDPYEVLMTCPFCHKKGLSADTGHHLSVNLKRGIFHCYRCESGGKLENTELAEFIEFTKPIEELDDIRASIEKLFIIRNNQSEEVDLDIISTPLSDKDTPFAYKYLIDRGFTQEEIIKYKICVGQKYTNKDGYIVRKWQGRILFPYIDDLGTRYVIGRSYLGNEPKYLNSWGSKNYVLYGIEFVNGPCIICEGWISAISAMRVTGLPAVSVLGKNVMPGHISMLQKKTNEVIISLDGGVDYKEIGKTFLKSGFKTWVVEMPKDKDPDDLGNSYLDYYNQRKLVIEGIIR